MKQGMHTMPGAGAARVVIAFLASALLACSLLLAGSALCAQVAAADIYSASAVAEQAAPSNEGGAPVADGAGVARGSQDAPPAAEGEVIEDEENPMASGMYKDSPATGSPVLWVIIIGILAVAGFFGFKMFRLNSNINKMKNKFH